MNEKMLLRAGFVLAWEEGLKVIPDGEITVEGGIVSYLGPRTGRPQEEFDRVIEKESSLVMPGLVNAHTHAAMTLFRGYADDMPLQEWLNDKIWPLEAKLDKKDIYWGTLLAICEMIRGGTTCFADMYFHMEEVAEACSKSGIRASLAWGLIGLDMIKGMAGLKESKSLTRNWHNADRGRITVMLGPHAPYTCPPKYLRKVMDLAAELDLPMHIHLAETAVEVQECRAEHGKTPVELVNDLGLFDYKVLAAHCVHLSPAEIEILSTKGAAVAHNPGSNLKLGSGIAPLSELLQKGALVSLGTDGAASNNNLDMIEELRLSALLPKGINCDPTALPAEDALKMATINGFQSLFLEKGLGSLQAGTAADLVMINLKKPHYFPLHNPLSHIVYSAAAADVEMVMVGGRVLFENGELKTIDEEKVFFEVRQRSVRLLD